MYAIRSYYGECSVAEVTVNVNEVNIAPFCINDTVRTFDGETIQFNVLTNDFDINGDEIIVTLGDDSGLNGFLTSQGNGLFNYVSVIGQFCSTESLTYQGCDSYNFV